MTFIVEWLVCLYDGFRLVPVAHRKREKEKSFKNHKNEEKAQKILISAWHKFFLSFYFLIFEMWFKFWIKNEEKSFLHIPLTHRPKEHKHLPWNQSSFIACLPAWFICVFPTFNFSNVAFHIYSYTCRAMTDWLTNSYELTIKCVMQLFNFLVLLISLLFLLLLLWLLWFCIWFYTMCCNK